AASPLRMARPGVHLPQRAEAVRGLCRPGRRGSVQRPRRQSRRSQGVPMRRGAQGGHQAVGVQGVRDRLHARAADRHLHGLLRGRLRGVLQLWPIRAREGSRVMAEPAVLSEREQRILGIIETARSKRPKFRDDRINMAHGAGGKATQALIEGLLAPAFASVALDEMADAGAVEIDGVELALTTDSYVVKPMRFPGGSIGELAVNGTVNDLA